MSVVSRFALAPLALALPLMAACAQEKTPAAPAAGGGEALVRVDASDREAIEAIVRNYLISHPEVLEEALQELAARRQAELARKMASDPRDYSIGPADAKVTIVEFFDYRCGYCKRSMEWLLEVAAENKDDVRVVFKEFPILSAESRNAALAALAAGRQGRYNEVHQALMSSKSDFSDAAIDAVAKAAGVDVKRMRADMKSKELQQQIVDVRSQAIEAGAESTPTFFINGRMIAGYDVISLNRVLEEELAKAG